MKFAKAALFASVPALFLAACSEPAPSGASQTVAKVAPATDQSLPTPGIYPAALGLPPVTASASPLAMSVDKAAWVSAPATPQAKRDMLIRTQVLLSRAHFSPGVIDGQDGGNMRNAVGAFEAARGLPEDGLMDEKVWAALAGDTGPVMTDYTITADDVKGPFTPVIPKKYEDMAKLQRLGFMNPVELLAEKFHMDEALLKALNPDADFAVAGTKIVVAAPGAEKLPGAVTRIDVDKTKKQVRAYGADGKLLASYPATVGSSETPTPAGEWAVNTVAPNPTWTYDPSRLNFGDKSAGKQIIKAGPNNPVGAVWIDLTKDTYGIHGAPDPRLVGKTASHGCVRLTNWDVRQLSQAVSKATMVVFLGADAKPAAQTRT
ncbi:L,D-transpeptidase family protein [Phenylobacterium sp.]|uniref:L,D-transpeptidase family protein n=1 Tax=Phenylobacterium sp. TaxID=1871053 RepID=UPI003983563A